LTLGSIERRSRQEQLAVAAFTEASAVFEQLGTPLWLARARAEMLSRQTLTPAEYRVARLTASGMTNGEVAAALFVSPKTVEFHLAGVYRKLGIRSRAELGRHMSKAE
jgi:DNA-binding CsgD family transcriptional regulator